MFRILPMIILFPLLCTQAFARGGSEAQTAAEEEQIHHNEWILCVTDFDVSAMPLAKLPVAGVITQKIVERLNSINYRTRVSPEYAYYEGYQWWRARSAAAKSLSAKHDERAQLLYRGDSSFNYRQSLARIDADIEKLKTAFQEIDENPPLINSDPVFSLTSGNQNFIFPPPPEKGKESKFCGDQKADAFLSGKITDFHGRFHISVRLYVIYTRTFIYEDSIIFSPDDLETAMDEIVRKLLMVISGNKPAAIAVKAEPADTLVLINRSFAGRGDTGILEYPPGSYTITASAAGHEGLTVETELVPNEIVNMKITLNPVEYRDIEIPGSAKGGGTVYHGALYVGETPLTLRLPVNALEYIELETNDGLQGKAIFRTPEDSDADAVYFMPVKVSKPPKKGRVEKARNHYYWSWGATWVTGLAAWVSYQTFVGMNTAIRYSYAATEAFDEGFYNSYLSMYDKSMGLVAAAGAVLVYNLVQLGRYLYVSNKDSTKAAKLKQIGRAHV
jgi:hypothetical protein